MILGLLRKAIKRDDLKGKPSMYHKHRGYDYVLVDSVADEREFIIVDRIIFVLLVLVVLAGYVNTISESDEFVCYFYGLVCDVVKHPTPLEEFIGDVCLLTPNAISYLNRNDSMFSLDTDLVDERRRIR